MSRSPGAITRRRDFASFSSSRDRGRSGPIRVVRVRVDGESDVAVAYALGRSLGTAVVRNGVRRRLRVLMRHIIDDEGLEPGRYLVSVAPSGATATFDDLRAHLGTALAQLS